VPAADQQVAHHGHDRDCDGQHADVDQEAPIFPHCCLQRRMRPKGQATPPILTNPERACNPPRLGRSGRPVSRDRLVAGVNVDRGCGRPGVDRPRQQERARPTAPRLRPSQTTPHQPPSAKVFAMKSGCGGRLTSSGCPREPSARRSDDARLSASRGGYRCPMLQADRAARP
jgi:hypothetical protein